MRCPPRVFLNLVVCCVVLMSATYAASIVVVPVESAADRFIKYVWVALIACAGWTASSLPVLADWTPGNVRRRLIIIQGFAKSLFFGFVGFWMASGAQQNVMACYLAAASGAYLGERYITFGWKKEPPGPPEPPDEKPAHGSP